MILYFFNKQIQNEKHFFNCFYKMILNLFYMFYYYIYWTIQNTILPWTDSINPPRYLVYTVYMFQALLDIKYTHKRNMKQNTIMFNTILFLRTLFLSIVWMFVLSTLQNKNKIRSRMIHPNFRFFKLRKSNTVFFIIILLPYSNETTYAEKEFV